MIDRPDWGDGGRSMMPAAPGATAGDPLGSRTLVAEMENWRPGADVTPGASLQPAPDESEIVLGIGLTSDVIRELQRSPDGFEAAYGRMFEAALEFEDRGDAPDWFVPELAKATVSLRMKTLKVLMHNPGATIEALYSKIKGQLTLSEAHEAEKLMRRLKGAAHG